VNPSVGPIALLGSGETSLVGGRVFETLAQNLSRPLRIAVLETPAGFELNSAQVAGRVADFLKIRLQNYDPIVNVVPARKRGTPFSPDTPDILTPLLSAQLVFMGPGSPTYAVRQLRGSLAWDLVRARHRLGAALVFASAATVAIGAWTLPVYEIYKVGEDVSAVPGLNLFADFGLSLSFIPHWNNTEGGEEVDTSRCFVGLERFIQWCALLPLGHITIGLDEHTTLIIDFAADECRVNGAGSVTLLGKTRSKTIPIGGTFRLNKLGRFQKPIALEEGISVAAWTMVQSEVKPEKERGEIPTNVLALADERQRARARKDWSAADRLRDQITALGWHVHDTADGQKLVK
jgi:hypothetical protein